MIKKSFLFIISAVTLLYYPGKSQEIDKVYSADSIRKDYTKEEVMIPVRDGLKLFTSIYSPEDKSVSYPILMVRSPFGSESYEDEWKGIRSKLDLISLFEEKYILVFQDVRGKFMSEGEFVDVRPYNPDKKRKETDENTDTYDAIDLCKHNRN